MKKQILLFVALVLILLGVNKYLMKAYIQNDSVLNQRDLINNEHTTPQKLFNKSWKVIRDNYLDETMNKQEWSRWKKHYDGKIKTDEDAVVAINTMLASLDDPYSRYLSKQEYSEQNTSIDSKITGIGVNIGTKEGKVLVVNVIEDTPAQAAGLRANDIVLTVDGKAVSGLQVAQVADLVRGPENTTVTIVIQRNKQKITKKIKRKEIKIKTVKSSIYKDIGYIQIYSFIGATTPFEFLEAIEKTDKTKGLIIDLRGNTGGLLTNATFIANLFIQKGNLVSIVGRHGYKKEIYAQETNFDVDKPLLILVDGTSASASEILSGALKDYHKAKLIGTKTFGKGMVQRIVPMPNGTGLNITIAKYLTPLGHDINKIGITPDINIEFNNQDIITRHDVQLEQAKILMAKMIKEEK